MSSADENSALKRNSVHQTRLSLELQQLERDRTTRMREMEKATQAFARRQEQIQGIRDKASLRRVPSAPPAQNCSGRTPLSKSVLASDSKEDLTLQPFVTKNVRLESAPLSRNRRALHKTVTMPSMDLLPSRSSFTGPSGHLLSISSDSTQKGTSPNKTGFSSPLQTPPNGTRVPMYSRNFSGVRQRNELMTASLPRRKTSLPVLSNGTRTTRSKSVSY